VGDRNLSDGRPTINLAVAAAFRGVAEQLERDGANPFRIRAYLRAATTLEQLRDDLAALTAAGRLQEIRGIGRDLAAKIAQFIETGAITSAPLAPGGTGGRRPRESAGAAPPPVTTIPSFLHIPGVTPAAARFLHFDLGIETPDDLLRMARSRLLRTVAGFGPELERCILSHFASGPTPNLPDLIVPDRPARDANP
jgi:DNA polymerase (family 10)